VDVLITWTIAIAVFSALLGLLLFAGSVCSRGLTLLFSTDNSRPAQPSEIEKLLAEMDRQDCLDALREKRLQQREGRMRTGKCTTRYHSKRQYKKQLKLFRGCQGSRNLNGILPMATRPDFSKAAKNSL